MLRDEDINFPPNTKNSFSSANHPVLKDLTLQGILDALKTQSTAQAEFEPYLAWMTSMLLSMGWTMEPESLDFMKAKAGSKNKKKKGKKAASTENEVPVE